MSVAVHQGDCLDVLRGMGEASVDSVVTDPPYGLEFMGKGWDAPWKKGEGTGEHNAGFKPGAPAVPGVRGAVKALPSFTGSTNPTCRNCGGTRHGKDRKSRRVCRCDAAEFPNTQLPRMRAFQDWSEAWAREVYRVMKPGAHLVAFGGTRTYHRMVCAIEDAGFEIRDQLAWLYGSGFPKSHNLPGGWGTALKPSHEPIVLARKPLACPTVAAQVLATGTGALNIDGCRVAHASADDLTTSLSKNPGRDDVVTSGVYGGNRPQQRVNTTGRWPANLVHDGAPEVLAAFEKFGERKTGGPVYDRAGTCTFQGSGRTTDFVKHGDTGTAARFFYSAKASKAERAGAKHPTVKPLALMRWLCRLVTPPGGVVLDCFAGTGVTGEAALLEGVSAVLIEREAEYVADCHRRLGRASGADTPLLSETAA